MVDAPGDHGAAAGIGSGLFDRRGFHARLTKRSISQIPQGLKPRTIRRFDAALKRRSSTVHAAFVVHATWSRSLTAIARTLALTPARTPPLFERLIAEAVDDVVVDH